MLSSSRSYQEIKYYIFYSTTESSQEKRITSLRHEKYYELRIKEILKVFLLHLLFKK